MFFSILHKRWRLTLICLCWGIGGGVRFPGCCTWLWNAEKTQGKNLVFQTWFVNERWLFVLLNQKVTIPPPFHRYGTFFCLEQFFESLFRIYLNCTKLWPPGAAVGEQLLCPCEFKSLLLLLSALPLQGSPRRIIYSIYSVHSVWDLLRLFDGNFMSDIFIILCSPPPWLQLSWLLSEVISACSQNSNTIMCLIIFIYLFIYQY